MELAEYALMDAAEGHMWWYRALHRRLLDALADVHGCVLDAGCGTGGLLAALRRAAAGPAARSAWNGPPRRPRAPPPSPACRSSRGSVNALPFAEASFDAAVAADLLCHARGRSGDGACRTAPRAAPGRQAGRQHAGLRLAAVGRTTGWCTTSAAAPRASSPPCCATPASSGVRTRYWNCLLLPLMVAQRKLLARAHGASDVAPFPPWLDAMFHAMTEIERRLPLPPAGRRFGAGDRGATMNDDTDLRYHVPADADPVALGVGLSIVIPVYRGAATIGRLVDALSALHPAGGLEIVLVNDGSPDNSGEVCQTWCDAPRSR